MKVVALSQPIGWLKLTLGLRGDLNRRVSWVKDETVKRIPKRNRF